MNLELSRREYIKRTYGRHHIIDALSGILSFGGKPFRPENLYQVIGRNAIDRQAVSREIAWNLRLGTIRLHSRPMYQLVYYEQITDAPEWEDITAEIEDVDRLYPPKPAADE